MRRPPRRAVVTVGVFDGVHRAHQQLIRETIRIARRIGGTSVAITFDPDPYTVLDPAHHHPALMPLAARLAMLRALGVDRIWVIPFTRRFARLTAGQFVEQILVGRLRTTHLVVGETFAFGHNREGDLRLLRVLGGRSGMRLWPLREIPSAGRPISSSRIRQLIAQGRFAAARRLLGRSPELYGVVVGGARRGRRLGFPTANIRLTSDVLPPQGVYAVLVHRAGLRRPWRGVMNLGVRPTFGPGPLVCEVHLLGFSGSLLGQSVAVSLLARLRGERCFPTIEGLRTQIRRDLARARQLFARLP